MKPQPRRGKRFGNPLQLATTTRPTFNKTGKRLPLTEKTPLKGWRRFIPIRRNFKFSWKKLLVSFLVVIGLVGIGITTVFAYYVRKLPNPKKLETQFIAQSTEIVDRNGKDLYTFHADENRTIIPSEQISIFSKQATIDVEDANFYNHHGFDPKGILRAAVSHFTHTGAGGGGSTITQQYVKNTALLANHSTDKTLSRKIEELILSIEVEQIYTKDEILTGYLNQINYGGVTYGIEAASALYFKKHAKDLTLSEAATLAAVPNNPTYYSPYGNHLDKLFVRKNYILDRMVEVSSITKAQADQAKKDAPTTSNPNFQKQDIIAPHFVFYIREQLLSQLSSDPQIAESLLNQSGYKVTTSLDIDTQNLAQQVITQLAPGIIKKYNGTNASLTAVDPKTGEVLAMVGSIDYDNSKSGNTNFADALLQPGSSFKPFVYATAYGPKYKYAPGSITYDLVTNFGGEGASKYAPTDYNGNCEFCGPVTNRNALASSLNVSAVKNLSLAGVKESINTAKSLGISTLNADASHYGLSIVLGSGEVRPVEMANAYGAFANGGMLNTLRPILKIEKGGKIVKDFTTSKPAKAIEPEVAYEISNVLSDNNARAQIFGTRNSLTLSDRPVAAKTGTTENNRDGWTIGYTPSISVAVWVGNNDPNKTMSRGADGSYVAAPIWNKFMSEYLKGKPVEQFTRPTTIKDVAIDKLSGKLPTDQTPPDSKITDIFAPWQVPKDSDDVHIKVKIDKTTGKLATDLTPAENIDEKTFFNVHSEVPDNPHWENPVQTWAKANGGGVLPPTDKDDIHTEENRPTISITTPPDSGRVSGTFTITANPGGSQSITKVDFYINNSLIGTSTANPWSTTYDASSLSPGSQVVQAVATNALGLTRSAQVTVTTNQTTSSGPDGVSNVAVNTVKGKSVDISWTNPGTPNLANVNIYLSSSSDPTDLGTKVKVVAASPNSIGSVSLDNSVLTVGKTYYIILRTLNSAGAENQSAVKYPIILS